MPYADADALLLMHPWLLRVRAEITRPRNGEGRGRDVAQALAKDFAASQTSHGVVLCCKARKVHLVSRTVAFRHAFIFPASARPWRQPTVWKRSLASVALA